MGVQESLTMLNLDFIGGVESLTLENRSSISSCTSTKAEQTNVLASLDAKNFSEIYRLNCDEPCADTCCLSGAIVWHPIHQIGGDDLWR